MDFQKLRSERFSRSTVHETAEEKYWKKFADVKPTVKFSYPITAIDFAAPATGGFDYAISSGTRVCIYDGANGSLKRSLNRFKDVAYGATFRPDGKLIAGGCKNSQVYIFDAVKGGLLRMLKGHRGAVRVTKWSPTGSHVLTCSDDKTARYWDVSTEGLVKEFRGHSDQVRSAAYCGTAPDCKEMWATGSYDHTIRLWDALGDKTQGCIAELVHDQPVEAVLYIPGGKPVVLGAAGNQIYVWDLSVRGKQTKPMNILKEHQRTVTTLFSDGSGSRILSGSLDGLLKVHDASTFQTISTVVVGSGQGILCAGMSKDNSALVIGCVSGDAIVKRRSLGHTSGEEKAALLQDEERVIHGGTKRYFMRGGNVGPSPGDFKVVSAEKKKKLASYEVHLRKFNYKQALDLVLKTRQPALVASLFEELVHRNGLEAALGGREDASLEPILSFLVKYVTNPRFADLLVDVCGVVLKLYSGDLGQSVIIDELFTKLRAQLLEELKLQKNLIKLSGTIDLLLSANSTVVNT